MLTVALEVGGSLMKVAIAREVVGSLMKVEENCRKLGRVCKSAGRVTADGSLFPLFFLFLLYGCHNVNKGKQR